MSTISNLRPVIISSSRDEKAVKKVRDSLTSWASVYRSGEVLVPKKNEKRTGKAASKQQDNTSFTAGSVKRTNIRDKLINAEEDLQILASNVNDPVSQGLVANSRSGLHRFTYMTCINAAGSIVDIGNYFSQRLKKSPSYYDIDSTLFSILAFLTGAQNDTEAFVTLSNINTGGKIKVLRGFKMFADATTDEEEYDAITTLYNDFVIGIVDRGATIFGNRILEHGGQNIIGQYNSSKGVRERIFTLLKGDITEGSHTIYPFGMESVISWNHENLVAVGPGAVDFLKASDPVGYKELKHDHDADVYLWIRARDKGAALQAQGAMNSVRHPLVHVDRQAWLADRGTPKRKSDENQMNIIDIPAYAQHLGVVTEIIAVLPAKFRNSISYPQIGPNGESFEKSRTEYNILGMNPANAGQLIYAHGIDFTPAPLDSKPGRTIDANGKSKKILTNHQALEGIIKRVLSYFDSNTKDGNTNILSLLRREKYLTVDDADFTQNSGYNLGVYTKSSVALLFPDFTAPEILSPNGLLAYNKEQFASRPDLILDLILYSAGFHIGKVAVNTERITNTIKGLYSVFSEVLDFKTPINSNNIVFNTIPVDRAASNNFLAVNYREGQQSSYVAPRGSLKNRPSMGRSMAPPTQQGGFVTHPGQQTAPVQQSAPMQQVQQGVPAQQFQFPGQQVQQGVPAQQFQFPGQQVQQVPGVGTL